METHFSHLHTFSNYSQYSYYDLAPLHVWNEKSNFDRLSDCMMHTWGVHSLLYFAYTCVWDLFIGGGGYLPCKFFIRWWYFTCKNPENSICDGILHVNMFHYFKIPYFTCTFFTNFIYNEYIGPYFLLHVVLQFSPVNSPRMHICGHDLIGYLGTLIHMWTVLKIF
jgi:hypothetical protein